MIGASIMYAALNPNLSAADFKQTCERSVASKERMLETVLECTRSLPTREQRVEYLSTALPLLAVFLTL